MTGNFYYNNETNIIYKPTPKKKTIKWLKHKFLILLLIPGLVSLIIFNYIPMYGIIIAFEKYNLSKGPFRSQWIGLENFIDIFRLPGVFHALINSMKFGIVGFVINFPAVIIFSILLNEVKNSLFKRFYQTISYFPYFLSWVVVSMIVINTLSPSTGIVNAIIKSLGGTPVYFMTEPSYFLPMIIISNLWKGIGWGSVIYMAAISNINPELYDAAYVDGAGRFRRILHVTLPGMYPVISITLIFSMSGVIFGGDFEQIFNLINSLTYQVGEVLSIYIYKIGLQDFNYSFSTAVSLLNNIVTIMLLYISNKIAARYSEYTIW